MYRTLAAILFALSLNSCDPGSGEAFDLLNSSDTTLYLTFINAYSKEETLVVSKPHSMMNFYQVGHIGCGGDPSDYKWYLKSFKIFRHDWQEISMDWNDSSRWAHRRVNRNKYTDCGTDHHLLEVRNEDI